ncbi:MAG: SEC-C domain-containing protein [Desulfomonilaceae bacterium]
MGSGNQRNQICPCGSGKKFKRCCMIKKPRQTRIAFRPRQSANQIRFRFSADGGIQLEGENGPIKVDVFSAYTGYERKKGFKTINQIPMDNQFKIEHPDLLLSAYDHFFIVDTNTVTIDGVKVSATCAMAGTSEISPSDSGVELIFSFIPTIVLHFLPQ